jgi:hypothetical protein
VTPPLPGLIANLLGEFAADLPDAPGTTSRAGTSWSRSGVEFAVAAPTGVEFRLDPAIAAAAAHTPDSGPSPRGAEWVRFNPRELDGHAIDRLRAWFELAYRRAGH